MLIGGSPGRHLAIEAPEVRVGLPALLARRPPPAAAAAAAAVGGLVAEVLVQHVHLALEEGDQLARGGSRVRHSVAPRPAAERRSAAPKPEAPPSIVGHAPGPNTCSGLQLQQGFSIGIAAASLGSPARASGAVLPGDEVLLPLVPDEELSALRRDRVEDTVEHVEQPDL